MKAHASPSSALCTTLIITTAATLPAQQWIVETFANAAQQDPTYSSSVWGSGGSPGARPGLIGGDGRHGEFSTDLAVDTGLIVDGRRVFELDTDWTVIPAAQTASGVQETVTDGRFFFSRMTVPADVRLRFVGTTPPIFTVAGQLEVLGDIEVNGQSVLQQQFPTNPLGQQGADGGIYGGSGGQGGDRCLGNGPGIGQFDGRDGADVNIAGAHGYFASRVGTGGKGSALYPASGLSADQQFGTNPPVGLAYCLSACAGGAGGGLYQPGQPGQGLNVFSGSTPLPNSQSFFGPPSIPGSSFPLFPFPPAQGLQDSLDHFLVGGSGGGGSASNATLSLSLARTWASGAGGGGGGGAMALRAGGSIEIDLGGRLLAVGGSARDYIGQSAGGQVAPAGGGSGGSIVLQAGGAMALNGLIDVRGGDGGYFFRQGGSGIGPNNGIVEVVGGDGGAGMVRLEAATTPPLSALASMAPAPTVDNVGPLLSRDPLTLSQSKWYSTGSANVIWQGYEADVDIDGDGVIDVTYGDSMQPGMILAAGGGVPLTLEFQSANPDQNGVADPATLGPWRDAVAPGIQSTIAGDGGALVRFRVVFVRNLSPTTVLRELRIQHQQLGPQSSYDASLVSQPATTGGLTSHQIAPLPTGGAVLFGGQGAGFSSFATREFTGNAWLTQASILNPLPRWGHTMTLDDKRGEVMMFGGDALARGRQADTWLYNQGQWTYLSLTTSPAPRRHHAMAYDPVSETILLFGGDGNNSTPLADMWSWDGTQWTPLTPPTAPPARSEHGMAFDQSRGKMVLFGGTDGTNRLDDVWEWDGLDWTQVSPAQPSGLPWGPSARTSFAMAFDPRSSRVVVMGGDDVFGCTDDVWSWNGVVWTRHFPALGAPRPSARSEQASFVDVISGGLYLHGGNCGSAFSDELWEIQFPVAARVELIGVGCPGSNGTPTLDVANGTWPTPGATVDLLYQNALNSPFVTPAILSVGFQADTYLGLSLPLPLGAIGLPGCILYHSNDVNIQLAVAPSSAQTSWSFTVPNNAALLGQEYFFQGLHLELAPGGPWAALSNAVGLRIGNQ